MPLHAIREKDKQTYNSIKTQHNIDQHEPHQQPGVISGVFLRFFFCHVKK